MPALDLRQAHLNGLCLAVALPAKRDAKATSKVAEPELGCLEAVGGVVTAMLAHEPLHLDAQPHMPVTRSPPRRCWALLPDAVAASPSPRRRWRWNACSSISHAANGGARPRWSVIRRAPLDEKDDAIAPTLLLCTRSTRLSCSRLRRSSSSCFSQREILASARLLYNSDVALPAPCGHMPSFTGSFSRAAKRWRVFTISYLK
eukprot:5505671-Prymnesium_polylepis.1